VLEKSFLSVEPKSLLLTSLKRSDDESSVVLRLNNPVDGEIRGTVHVEANVKEVYRGTMNEDVVGPMELLNGHDIPVTVKPFEVMTILLKL
jgi:alpha-mannosidase